MELLPILVVVGLVGMGAVIAAKSWRRASSQQQEQVLFLSYVRALRALTANLGSPLALRNAVEAGTEYYRREHLRTYPQLSSMSNAGRDFALEPMASLSVDLDMRYALAGQLPPSIERRERLGV